MGEMNSRNFRAGENRWLRSIRRGFSGLAIALSLSIVKGGDQERPNILWITFEDASPTLGCYGDSYAKTPHLDALASRGVRFTRAFATTGVCATARSSLILGMHSSSAGTQHMRSKATLPDSLRPFPYHLRESGYYCSNNVKTDYNFETPQGTWDESSRQAHWRNRKGEQPFFSVFNFMITHESRIRGHENATNSLRPEQLHDPAEANLPPYLPDTPATRRDWARYHDLLTTLDSTHVPRLLAELEEDGLSENTIIFAFSDHGVGLPRAKQFVFDSGMHVPLIAYFPEKWRHLAPAAPGETVDELVSFVDFAPTMLRLAGAPLPDYLQGKAFAGGAGRESREFVFGTRDRMDERIDMNRTVRSHRFKYHRNYMPHLPHYPWLDYMDRLDTAKDLRRLAKEGRLDGGLAYFMGTRKSLEELYDLEADPYELRNLADDPEYAGELERLREAHFKWVRETADTGYIPEQMLRDLSEGVGEYAFARSDAYQLEECIATVRLMERGSEALPELRSALRHPYPPVRYWAAVGLANLGEQAATAANELEAALDDAHAEVAIAAAEALCYLGRTESALGAIESMLESGRPLERLAAANVADRADELARPILATMRREAEGEDLDDLDLMTQWVLAKAVEELEQKSAKLTLVGVASVDITPPNPVRLHAFPRGPREASVSEVSQRIYAKAMAIGTDESGPSLVVAADLLGIGEEMADALFERLRRDLGFHDRSRLAVTATHNHSAPALSSVAPYVFRKRPSEKQAAEIREYESFLMDRLFEVARAALESRSPSHLSFAKGSLDFAVHRRIVENGKWVGFGENDAGPVDQDMPLMAVRFPSGALRAAWATYACHGVCWRAPSVHGDWMGVAQEAIERRYPGTVALVSIGCAGDINPLNATGGDPRTPGLAMAKEVSRLLDAPMRPLPGSMHTRFETIELPLQRAPGKEFWETRSDWYSQSALETLRRGDSLPERLAYPIQSWAFGESLAMVFLAGEVSVEYGLRLKEAFDSRRLWVNAYANAMPAYIPTAGMLSEGGWEVDASRYNYGVPARLASEAEGLLLKEVGSVIPSEFRAEENAEDKESSWWENTGHPKGKWWTSYPGYEGEAADEIWKRVEIPPSPVRSAEEALETFRLPEGFEIELVAAEPLVVRPVHMQFDPEGRLWVVEMPGYMRDIDGSEEEEPSGRVVILEDTNQDGRMDRSTVFLDNLVMPRTVSLVDGGALVVEPPRIWYAEDLDGDLMADRKTLLTEEYGVGGNPEHSANWLYRAIDNWRYSAKSETRYRFTNGELLAEPTAFRGQWGISQDDSGRLYYNYNASPLHTELVPAEYLLSQEGVNLALARNVVGQGLVNYNMVSDKSLYPVRVTPLVTLGASDLREDGTLKQFTAACSPHIYRGNQWPESFKGDAFVCDPVGNLVARFRMGSVDGAPKAERAYEQREFLASTDERFRPVALQEGPDGALYLADMYTGIVEHKRYVTEYLRNQVLSRGMGQFTETGRIYRIVATNRSKRTGQDLSDANWKNLVESLSSDNGWTRDTAQRLLDERSLLEAAPRLRTLAKMGDEPLGRLHALWTLDALNQVNRETLEVAALDSEAQVRSAAIRLSERFLNGRYDGWAKRLYENIEDVADSDTRLQLVLSAGRSKAKWAMLMIGRVLASADDWRLPPAAAAGLQGREMEFVRATEDWRGWSEPSDAQRRTIAQLGRTLMQRGNSEQIEELFSIVDSMAAVDWRRSALMEGASKATAEQRIELQESPAVLSELLQSTDQALREWGIALSERVSWVGRESEAGAPTRVMSDAEQALFEKGKAGYQTMCAACHQPNGEGMVGLAPPLAGSEWVTSDPRIAIRITLQGLTGPIEVRGQEWDMAMAGFAANPSLMDDEAIAAIITYIRNEWGNAAEAVVPEQVADERKATSDRRAPWTSEELKTLK